LFQTTPLPLNPNKYIFTSLLGIVFPWERLQPKYILSLHLSLIFRLLTTEDLEEFHVFCNLTETVITHFSWGYQLLDLPGAAFLTNQSFIFQMISQPIFFLFHMDKNNSSHGLQVGMYTLKYL